MFNTNGYKIGWIFILMYFLTSCTVTYGPPYQVSKEFCVESHTELRTVFEPALGVGVGVRPKIGNMQMQTKLVTVCDKYETRLVTVRDAHYHFSFEESYKTSLIIISILLVFFIVLCILPHRKKKDFYRDY